MQLRLDNYVAAIGRLGNRLGILSVAAAGADDVAAHAVAGVFDSPAHWLAHCVSVKRWLGMVHIAWSGPYIPLFFSGHTAPRAWNHASRSSSTRRCRSRRRMRTSLGASDWARTARLCPAR
eukprot:9470601-Pyramimonas_sp.AAC.1